MNITRELRPALSLVLLFTLFTGLLFPAAFTGIMQVALPFQANGSLVEKNGQVATSDLATKDSGATAEKITMSSQPEWLARSRVALTGGVPCTRILIPNSRATKR